MKTTWIVVEDENGARFPFPTDPRDGEEVGDIVTRQGDAGRQEFTVVAVCEEAEQAARLC